MTASAPDASLKVYARIAGFMFLLGLAAYLTGQAIAPRVNAPGDFAATARNVAASGAGLHLSLALMFVTSWGTVILAGSLYALLKAVHPMLALIALVWRAIEAALGAVVIILGLVGVDNYVGAAGGKDLDVHRPLVQLIDAASAATLNIATIFFTGGSTVFFYLLLKSRFIPRVISLFGLAASILFAALVVAELLALRLPPPLNYAWAPMLPAEFVAGLWMLVMGANLEYRKART